MSPSIGAIDPALFTVAPSERWPVHAQVLYEGR